MTGPGYDPIVNVSNTKRLVKELKPYCQNCILVHGTGNFGKPPAIEYGYYKTGIIHRTYNSEALQIKQSLKDLNQQVISILHEGQIRSKSICIDEYYESENLRINENELERIVTVATISKVLPVFYGDISELPDGSFKVLSSDQIVLSLAKLIKPKSVIFLSNVEGVLLINEVNGDVYIAEEITVSDLDNLYFNPNDQIDVSGGMSEKVNIALEISDYCDSCFIGNGFAPGLLSDVLNKKKVNGTYVKKN